MNNPPSETNKTSDRVQVKTCRNCNILLDKNEMCYFDASTNERFFSCGQKCLDATKWVRDALREERERVSPVAKGERT